MNKKLPYKDLADTVASRGRYGDTTLIHVNPIEVEGLASLMPLTRNPDTGYPEAFLPLLAPVLGSTLAPALLGGTALGGALGTVGLSALGSGVGTTLATGSVEEGLMAGLAGFGIGSALQGAQSAVTGSQAVTDAVSNTGNLAETITPDVLDKATEISQNIAQNPGNIGFTAGPIPEGQEILMDIAKPSNVEFGAQYNALNKLVPGTGFGNQVVSNITQNPTTSKDILTSKEGMKAFGKELLKPMNIAATGAGIGGVAVKVVE